jgi:hypothetical protein
VTHRPLTPATPATVPAGRPEHALEERALSARLNAIGMSATLATLAGAAAAPLLIGLGAGPHVGLAVVVPTLLASLVWMRLLRPRPSPGIAEALTSDTPGWGWLWPLTTVAGALAGTFLFDAVLGLFLMTLGALAYVLPLMGVVMLFRGPVVAVQRARRIGVTAREQAELGLARRYGRTAGVALAMEALLLPFVRMGWRDFLPIAVVGTLALALGESVRRSLTRSLRQRADFVLRAEAGEIPGYRVLVRDDNTRVLVTSDAPYRAASEQLAELDEHGDVTRTIKDEPHPL